MKKCYDEYIDEVNELFYQKIFDIPHSKAPKFQVEQADILKYDWSDADLVLANSTCFEYKFMEQIADKAKSLKKGSWFITLTKRIPTSDESLKTEEKDDRDWDCVLSIKLQMSWGLATLNIHQKIKHPPKQL